MFYFPFVLLLLILLIAAAAAAVVDVVVVVVAERSGSLRTDTNDANLLFTFSAVHTKAPTIFLSDICNNF